MLKLKAVEKKFGSRTIFNIPVLELQEGLYRIKGANGSGKSTLLRVLAGLIPFQGNVWLDDFSLRQHPDQYRMRVNHAPAEPAFPSFLTGTELVEFVTAVKKGNTKDNDFVKEKLGIDQFPDQPTGSYSSGMLKKLSLLLAFAGHPQWILLDEPFTTLDTASQEALASLIAARHREGVSFMLTSHHEIELPNLPFTQQFLMQDQQLVPLS